MGGACSADGGKERYVYTGFSSRTLGKETNGISRLRRDYKVKMDLKEVGCRGMDWIQLARDRESWRVIASAIINFWVR
jgi:hypothetical protein